MVRQLFASTKYKAVSVSLRATIIAGEFSAQELSDIKLGALNFLTAKN
jgi:hypothetical protein